MTTIWFSRHHFANRNWFQDGNIKRKDIPTVFNQRHQKETCDWTRNNRLFRTARKPCWMRWFGWFYWHACPIYAVFQFQGKILNCNQDHEILERLLKATMIRFSTLTFTIIIARCLKMDLTLLVFSLNEWVILLDLMLIPWCPLQLTGKNNFPLFFLKIQVLKLFKTSW